MAPFDTEKVVTAEALADVNIPSSVQLSPSGRQVVYVLAPAGQKDKNATSSIWIADVGEKHSARQLTSGLFSDTQPQWSPDGNTIAFKSDRAKAGESSAIYLLPLKGGEAYPITKTDYKNKITGFTWSPNGRFIAFLSPDEKSAERKAKEEDKDDAMVWGEYWEYDRLRIIHVATREVSTLVSKDAHVNDFTWNHDSTEIAYILHELPELDSPRHGIKFERVKLSTYQISAIAEFPGEVGDLIWTKKDIFFTGGVRESSSNTSTMVYKLSLDKLAWEKHSFGTTDDAVNMRLTGDKVWVRVQSGLHEQIHLLDSDEILYNEAHDLKTWDVALSKEQPVLVLSKSSINSPLEIYSLQEGKLTQLSQHGVALATLNIGTDQPFYAKAQDGTDLDAVFMTPYTAKSGEAEEGKSWPTFVLVHGGPYGRSSIAFDPAGFHWAPWIVSAGYAVMCPNYRGGSGHGDKYASAAVGGMGTSDYDDVITLVKAGISRGLIDKDRVVIGGWSQGGFLSYLSTTRRDFQFRGAICGAGVTDWDLMSMTSDIPAFEAELVGKAPWEEGSRKTQDRHGSAIWHMEKIKTPILILHGEKDVRVPTSQAIAFHRGCLHHGIPCEMVIYPREGHAIKERNHRIDMLKRIRRFIDLHLS